MAFIFKNFVFGAVRTMAIGSNPINIGMHLLLLLPGNKMPFHTWHPIQTFYEHLQPKIGMHLDYEAFRLFTLRPFQDFIQSFLIICTNNRVPCLRNRHNLT